MTRSREWLYGWLLVLPAAALLALFTHYPIVATLWGSFHSTPKGARPAVWVGLDNYQALVDDPIFWKSLVNNWLRPRRCAGKPRPTANWRGSLGGATLFW